MCAIFIIPLFFLAGFLMWLFNNSYATIAIALFFCVVGKLIIKAIAKKYIFSILYKEMDAFKFKSVIEDKHFFCTDFLWVLSAYSLGDYQTTINICTKKLMKNSRVNNKYFYLLLLARSYFELRDIEKLHVVCDKFEYYLLQEKKAQQIRKQYSVMQFFQYFLKKDFDACKLYYESRINNSEKVTKSKNNLLKLQSSFYYAIACYKTNDIEKAEEIFNKIIEIAPKINFANLSKRYLEEISGLEETVIEILPDFNYVLPNEKKMNILIIFKKTLIFIVILLLIFAVCLRIIHYEY